MEAFAHQAGEASDHQTDRPRCTDPSVRMLLLIFSFACGAHEPLECVELEFEVKRTFGFELSAPREAEAETRTLIEIWDAPGIADASANGVACVLAEGLPDRIDVAAPRFTPMFMSSYATLRADLEGDGIGGCDLYAVHFNVPTDSGAYTIAVEMEESDECR